MTNTERNHVEFWVKHVAPNIEDNKHYKLYLSPFRYEYFVGLMGNNYGQIASINTQIELYREENIGDDDHLLEVVD